MDLYFFALFYLHVITAMVKKKQTVLFRYPLLQNKNMTTDVISTMMKTWVPECAQQCASLGTCESFFFNTVTGDCQLLSDVFITPDGGEDQIGLRYYYIIKGSDDWCPMKKGFNILPNSSMCVKYHTDKKNWSDAKQICESYSPYLRLVILNNQQNNELVKAKGHSINDDFGTGLWIGLSELAQDDYKWVDGVDLEFTDWNSRNSDHLDKQDCVHMRRDQGWTWSRRSCDGLQHYICEVFVDIELYHKMMDIN